MAEQVKKRKVKTSRMDDTKYFSKIYHLVLKLQTPYGISAAEIEEFLGSSRRTAQRTINDLEYCFGASFIKETGRPPRYRIDNPQVVRSIIFSEDELLAVQKAAKILKQKKDNDYLILDKLQEKIRIKNESKYGIDLDALLNAEGVIRSPAPYKEIKKEFVDEIRKSIKNCHPIRIKYLSKQTKTVDFYEICPYGILYGEQNHYMLAKSLRPKNKKEEEIIFYFILSNIYELEILEDQSFAPDEDFSVEKFTKDHFGMWHEEPFECEWLFSKKAALEAKQFKFHSSQEMIENPDGTLTVKFFAGGVREMEWYLHTWGEEVKVIKPTDFAERLKKSAPIRY